MRPIQIGATVLIAVAAGIAGCGNGDDLSSGASGATTTAATAQSKEELLFGDSERVSFPAPDGPEVGGRLWRGGPVGVILAHGHDLDLGQRGWVPFNAYLNDLGYTVLSFNFRGFCDTVVCSPSELDYTAYWNDVVGAVEYLRSTDVDSVFLVGASMGGIGVLRAAAFPGVEVDGVVSLSTPQWPSQYYSELEPPENDVTPERLALISEPILFVAGDEEVTFADDAVSMHGSATGPAELLLVPSAKHSSQLVTHAATDVVEQTRAALIAFFETHAAA